MKYIIIILALLLVMGSNEYVMAQSVQMKLGDYSISALSAPKKENGALPFLQASFGKAPKSPKAFGFWYAENENAMSDVVFEIADAATNSLVKKITAADLAGKSKVESLNKGARVVATYQFGTAPALTELQIESELQDDATSPLGMKIHVSYKLRMQKAAQLNAVLNLKTDGSVQKLGTASVATTRMEKENPVYPAMVASALSAVNLTLGSRTKGIQIVSFQAEKVSLKEKEWATVFSFEIAGTTVKDADKTIAQANRVVNRIAMNESKPDLAIFNAANAMSTVPGDTITYSITYCNIGSAIAQNAEITNPVAEGVTLIEKSIDTKEADVVIERKPATAPELGAPALVRWKIKKGIMPGEEGKLTMKVIVR